MSRPTPSPDQTVPLRQRAQRLLRHRFIALVVALVVLCAGVPFVLTLPPLYRASATVLIEGGLRGLGTERSAIETEGRLQVIKQEALSRAKLLSLIERFDLYPGLRGRVPIEVLVERLEQDIKMTVDSRTDQTPATSFTLSYTGLTGETAAAVTNALASFFVERNDTLRTLQSSQATKYLEEQIAETRKRLDAQASRVKDFASRNSGALPQQLLAGVATVQRYNMELQQNGDEHRKQAERRQELQRQLAELNNRPPDPVMDPVASTLAAKRKDLTSLLASGATDLHPDVRILRTEIAQLEKQQSTAPPRPVTGVSPRAALEQALKETNARLGELERERQVILGNINRHEGRVASSAVREPDLMQLNREYAATRDSLDSLQRQYDQARLTERASTGDRAEAFRVIDPAVPPGGSVGPNRNRLLFALLSLALLAGIGAALLADRLDTSFGSVDELRAFTRVPVLASIPQIATWRDTRARWTKLLLGATAAAVVLTAVAAAAVNFARGNELLARLLLRMG